MRINKYLAHKGYATRREADQLIERGVVYINGARAALGAQVTDTDKVEVRGRNAISALRTLAYYKPKGVVTNAPQKKEKAIEDVIKGISKNERLRPVGRLDKDSEGLILLTNDPRIIEPLLSPEAEHEKEYEVEVVEQITRDMEAKFARGIRIGSYTTKPSTVVVHSAHTFSIIITEGKNRQIRRMCAALGYSVEKLKRVRIMHVPLGKLVPNTYRPLGKEETDTLYKEIGIDL